MLFRKSSMNIKMVLFIVLQILVFTVPYGTACAEATPTVYIAGDSTVMTYKASDAPQAGWGQYISDHFENGVQFVNRAIGGRSSKTFVEDGRLDSILKVIKPNDYLFIQFGHNDASSVAERHTDPETTYKQYLKMYIDGARSKGAIPVLITPVGRLNYKNNVFQNDFPAYCRAMKELSDAEKVKCIDLMTTSLEQYTAVGYKEAFTYFMVSSNGTDYTHFTQKGAQKIAELVANGVAEIDVPISKYVKGYQSQVKLGDVNDDTTIDALDLAELKWFLLDQSTPVNKVNADMNGDEAVDALDLPILKIYLLNNE